jgi:DNA polymerase V
MYALVDCNNFYASCERVFNPRLERSPIVVLSNNDGCIISRSEEAKQLGIRMGAPAHLVEDLIKKNNVKVFSSNYTLYGDMSDRVMKTLAEYVPRMEIYSIDEAFLDMHDMPHADLLTLGFTIRRTIRQFTGIPVCVGIAPTKTLAKMANRFAKKRHRDLGVFYAANEQMVNEMLAFTEVGDVWGIGHQHALFLKRHGFKTAQDLLQAPDEWIRQHMSVVGLRLVNELRGTPAIDWEFEPAAKKNICTGRSFGKLVTEKNLVKEAMSNYAAACALKLQAQHMAAKQVRVFIQTNPFRAADRQYFRSIIVQLPIASNSTLDIIRYAVRGFEIIYKDGFNYHKAGVELSDFVDEDQLQLNLFESENTKQKTAMAAVEKLNLSLGKDTVKFGIQGFKKAYKARAAFLSPKYTTNLDEVITIRH